MAVGLKNRYGRSDLVFEFPNVHADATLRVSLHRTLRLPDDGRTYGLLSGIDKNRPRIAYSRQF